VPEAERPASAADARDLAALLARAFHDDPMMTWVVPDAARRPAFLRALFAANLRSARRSGRVDLHPLGADGTGAASPAGAAGAAFWLAPGRFPLSRWRMLGSGHLLLPLRLDLTGWRRLARVNRYALMLHHRTAPGPHWYLHGLGVEPSRQRQGIGDRLIAIGTERADRDRLPCYLETAVESTLPLYERHAFRVEIRGRVPPEGPPIWAMLRPARRSL
jgi:GNAT superfamily N-acetyltransferase